MFICDKNYSTIFFLCIFIPGAFEGEDVTHVEGEVNPVRDLGIISEELRKKVSILTIASECKVLVLA